MTTKADFNADEWSTITEAPMLAALRTVAAGRGGTIRESIAVGKVYAEAKQGQETNPLVAELVGSPPSLDPQKVQGEGGFETVSGERLREALRLLGEKASPDEVEAYKGFVLSLARAAAEAHKEGGFIGIGGKQVSPEEQAALDEIEAQLQGS